MAGRKYLADGELVGLIDDGSRSDYQDVPYVQGSVWKAEDGSLGVIIANCRAQTSSIACSLDPRDVGLRDSVRYRCSKIHPAGGVAVDLPAGMIAIHETLDPLEVRILAIARAE